MSCQNSISLVCPKIKTKTGYKIPALSALTNNANVAKDTVPAITLDPVHRVVPPVVDFSYSNNAQSVVPAIPANAYGSPPAVPARSYGLPNES